MGGMWDRYAGGGGTVEGGEGWGKGREGREGRRPALAFTLTHPLPPLSLLQRLKHVVALGYSYCRPVAYYGMIPFVLYVGMNGDAAPNWSDLPRYLIAVL